MILILFFIVQQSHEKLILLS